MEDYQDMDDFKEYPDTTAGRFEEMVDKVVEIRRSIFDGICEQIKSVAGNITGGGNSDDEFAEPGPIAQIVDTVNSVDQTIVEGTAGIIKNIGNAVLGILG